MAEEQREADVAAAGDGLAPAAGLPAPAARAAVPVVLGVVVLFALLVVVIWRTGVFDSDTSASDAQIVAGMLTLLGGLIASAFTLVGLLLKHSIDQHSARLAQETERQRRLEARETEHRLRLETSIKAVELLTLPDGTPAPSSRHSGALFVLGSPPLQQLDLAVALLNENWSAGKISSSAAIWVVDRGLKQDDPDLQTEAAETLRDHAELLPYADGSGLAWPNCVDLKWPAKADYFARAVLLEACSAVLAQRGPDRWQKGTINWFIVEFDVIRKSDRTREIQCGATLVLDLLLDWYLRRDPHGTLLLPAGELVLSTVRTDLASLLASASTDASEQMWNRVTQLRADWGYGVEEPSPDGVSAPGS